MIHLLVYAPLIWFIGMLAGYATLLILVQFDIDTYSMPKAFSMNAVPALFISFSWIIFIPSLVTFAHKRQWTASVDPAQYALGMASLVLMADLAFWGPSLGELYFMFIAPWLGYALIYALAFFTLKKLQNAEAQKGQV